MVVVVVVVVVILNNLDFYLFSFIVLLLGYSLLRHSLSQQNKVIIVGISTVREIVTALTPEG